MSHDDDAHDNDDFEPPPDPFIEAIFAAEDAIAAHYARDQAGLPPPIPQDPDWARKWIAHMHGTTYRPREADPPEEEPTPPLDPAPFLPGLEPPPER